MIVGVWRGQTPLAILSIIPPWSLEVDCLLGLAGARLLPTRRNFNLFLKEKIHFRQLQATKESLMVSNNHPCTVGGHRAF